MFVHEELLSIVFRLVNFGILLFLCVYLFKRYLLPTIEDQMRDEQEELHAMKERHQEIENQEKIVAAFARDQEKLCQLLQKNVTLWRQSRDSMDQERAHEKEQRREALQKKVAEQERDFARQQALQALAPEIMQQTTEALKEKFAHPEQRKKYMQDILVQLRKEQQ